MAQMSMNKVIHGAVRRDLARFATALAGLRAGDRPRAIRLATAWSYFYAELHHHHLGEHDIVWETLTVLGADPILLETFDAEHAALADALDAADRAFGVLAADPAAAAIAVARDSVAELHAVAEKHLLHEEAELEPFLAARHGAPELKAMGRRLAQRSPRKSADFLAWVQNGASPAEKAALRSEIPAPVVEILGRLGLRYRRIASVF